MIGRFYMGVYEYVSFCMILYGKSYIMLNSYGQIIFMIVVIVDVYFILELRKCDDYF